MSHRAKKRGLTDAMDEEVGATDMTDQFRTSSSHLIDWHGVWENGHLFIQMTSIRHERHKDAMFRKKKKETFLFPSLHWERVCWYPEGKHK